MLDGWELKLYVVLLYDLVSGLSSHPPSCFLFLFVCLFIPTFLPCVPHGSSYQSTRLCYTSCTLPTVHRCLGRSSSSTVGWRMSAGSSRRSTALPSNSGKTTCASPVTYMYDTPYMCQHNRMCTPSHLHVCAPSHKPQIVPQTAFFQGTLLCHHILPAHVQTHTTL